MTGDSGRKQGARSDHGAGEHPHDVHLEPRTDAPHAPEREGRDVVFVRGTDDESPGAYRVIRQRDERVELGLLRAPREGRPILGELVRLHQRPEHERLFDVEVLVDVAEASDRSGPPRVATAAYRRNWESIFGGQRASDELN